MKMMLLFMMFAGIVLAGWGEALVTVDGQRYSVLYSVDRADCKSFPTLKECLANPPVARAAVVVFRRIDNEPADERSGVAGSTRVEVGRTYIDCTTYFCRQDSREEWVRTAMRRQTK